MSAAALSEQERSEEVADREVPSPAGPAPLTPAQGAAVMIMLLGDEQAARLLARLEPEELQAVGKAMIALGEVDARHMAAAIAGFIEQAQTETLPDRDREQKLMGLLDRAVGEARAQSLMQRIAPDRRPIAVETARWLAPQILVMLIEEVHPQVIAVLLLMLEAETAAEVLSSLPLAIQPAVIERIARLDKVSAEAVEMLDRLLASRIERRYGKGALRIGGPREAAQLVNLAERQVSETVIPAISQRDEELARAIEAEMFTFEMLLDLDPQSMGRLLREVDNADLVRALKGFEEEARAPFFAAMSSRAADGVRDEIEMLPRLKREEVLAAQKAIVDIARALLDSGELVMGDADGEFI